MKIKLNFSTCPNDTFMFDALVNRKIDCKGLQFEVHMADIEELNSIAMTQNVDVSKLSYATYPLIKENYKILTAGSALGYGSGPLLVSKHKVFKEELSDVTVAIPGEHTTANRLLEIAFPEIQRKKQYLFSDISEAILDGEVEAGVLIHEERFTYASKGLQLVADLGKEWENRFHLPIALGAIVVNRSLEPKVQHLINTLLEESIRYAFANPLSSREFVKKHARELSDETIDKHIKMFVNDYSLNIGAEGREAVIRLLGDADFV